MTNYKHLRNLSIGEFAEWLSKLSTDDSPWILWFSENYCHNCQPIMRRQCSQHGDCPAEMEYSYCEINDDKCRYFDKYPEDLEIIKMWLNKKFDVDRSGI